MFAMPSWPAPYARWETTFALIGAAMLLAGAVTVPIVYLRAARKHIGEPRGSDVAVALVVAATISAAAGVGLGNPLLVIFSLLTGGVAGVSLWLKAPIPPRREIETAA